MINMLQSQWLRYMSNLAPTPWGLQMIYKNTILNGMESALEAPEGYETIQPTNTSSCHHRSIEQEVTTNGAAKDATTTFSMTCLEKEAATYGAAEPVTPTFSTCREEKEAATDAAAEAATTNFSIMCLEEEDATYGAAEPATPTFSMCIEEKEAATDAAAEAATTTFSMTCLEEEADYEKSKNAVNDKNEHRTMRRFISRIWRLTYKSET